MIPQAVRIALPNYFNYVLGTFKATSLVFAVGVMDIMAVAKLQAEMGYRFIESYTLVGIFYVIIGLALAYAFKIIENRNEQ